MSIRSVHSRRTVPTQRSANEFARGACGGDLITSIPSPVNTASKTVVNFAVAVAEQEPQLGRALVEVHEHVSGLLGDPGAGRMGGHAGHLNPAGGDLHEEKYVDPLEEHGIDSEEIAGQDRLRLGGEELLPGRAGPAGCRVHAGLIQDLPDGAGRDLVAQADQFALDPAVPPRQVLRGQPQHQLADLSVDRWPARPGTGVRPMPSNELPVPAKEGRRGDNERRPLLAGQQPRQGGQDHPVGRLQLGAAYLAAQHCYLVAENQEFDVFGPAFAGELGQRLQHLPQQHT